MQIRWRGINVDGLSIIRSERVRSALAISAFSTKTDTGIGWVISKIKHPSRGLISPNLMSPFWMRCPWITVLNGALFIPRKRAAGQSKQGVKHRKVAHEISLGHPATNPSPRVSVLVQIAAFSKKQLTLWCSYRGAPSGVPAGATFQVEYTSSTDFGAVLACLAPIRREAYYYSDPFKAWAQANMVALASGSLRDDIRENGFFIVTQTHATQKYTLTAWNEKNKSACIGFSVDVEGGAALKADSRWYEGRSVNGWETAQGDGTVSRSGFQAPKSGALLPLPEETC